MTRATTSDAIAIAGDQLPTRAGRYCLIAWGVLSALLWLVFATVAWHFHRARRGWPVTKLHGIRVLVAPDVGPVVVGVLHPAVVIPQWLLRRDTKEQRLALVHEQEHMRAGDPLVLAGACLVAALLPWHPAVWWMLARLRLAVELDCDRRVLGQGIAPRAYGDLLIDLAGRCARLPISTSASALTDEASHLTRRLLAMKRSRIPLARTRGVALGSVALLTVVFACTVPAPNQDVTFLRWRGRAATIPDVAIPRSIAAAEAEGTAWPRDSIVDTTRWARLPKTGGSPERKCLTTDDGGRDRAPGYIEIRTGDFRIGGQLDSLAAGRTPRMWIWWDPLHDPAIRRSGLLVRAALLDAPGLPNSTNTARFTMLDYIRPGDPLGSNPTDEEIRAELEHYRSAALFGSALTLPMRGRWLLVATSGDDWGCLVVNVR